jgi:hypothetical protein
LSSEELTLLLIGIDLSKTQRRPTGSPTALCLANRTGHPKPATTPRNHRVRRRLTFQRLHPNPPDHGIFLMKPPLQQGGGSQSLKHRRSSSSGEVRAKSLSKIGVGVLRFWRLGRRQLIAAHAQNVVATAMRYFGVRFSQSDCCSEGERSADQWFGRGVDPLGISPARPGPRGPRTDRAGLRRRHRVARCA